jgi:hypothetical protein
VFGKDPSTFPLPIWLFDRFTRGDVTVMWCWLHDGQLHLDTSATRSIHPSALTVGEWMLRQRSTPSEV